MTRIDNSDLSLFEFDYDLTFMVFFLDGRERIYARYGGRDSQGPDSRQSLAGLRYTMESVLQEHRKADPRFAPGNTGPPFFIRSIAQQLREVLLIK